MANLNKASLGCELLLLVLPLLVCARRPAYDPQLIFHQATLLRQRGELRQALDLADRGLSQLNEHNSADWYARFRLLRAEVLISSGRTPEALAALQASAAVVPHNAEFQARWLLDRGWAESSLSHFQESKKLLDQALQLAEASQLERLVTETKLRRGAVMVRLDDMQGAQADFRSALQSADRSQDDYLKASALGNLGFLRMGAARYDEAVMWFDRALVIFERMQMKSSIARALNDIGYCYIQLGRPENALPMFERAERLATETGDLTDRYISLGRLADSSLNQGDYDGAFSYYRQAIAVARQAHSTYWTAKWAATMAAAAIERGDLAGAEDYNRQAIELEAQVGNSVERLPSQINAARIAEARGQPGEAENIYRSVTRAAQNLQGTEALGLMLDARGRLANLLARADRKRAAEAEFRLALEFINARRSELVRDDYRISYLASRMTFYKDYVDFLMTQHRDVEALAVAESSRARVLAENLGSSGLAAVALHPDDYRRVARATNSILLSYWLAPKRSFLWVVTRSKVAGFVLPPAGEIAALAQTYASTIEGLRDPLQESGDAGRMLYQTLVAPAHSLIPRGSNVAIVEDGALHNLNFESLPVFEPHTHYWIDDVTVSVVPALGLLYRNLGRPPHPNDSLLLIGDPQPPDQKAYPQLLNVALEIAALKRQFGRAAVYTGAEAKPEAYSESKPEQFSVIHFAAHAEANHNDPLDSAIILSPNGESYKLYARDVLGIPIRANLVTLSACRSAGSRTFSGEGLVGFAWAFLQAGAQSVVAGLWEVDDASTVRMMETMYAQLHLGVTPQQSLRIAKLAMLRSDGPYRKPYYWAPFQLITDALPRAGQAIPN